MDNLKDKMVHPARTYKRHHHHRQCPEYLSVGCPSSVYSCVPVMGRTTWWVLLFATLWCSMVLTEGQNYAPAPTYNLSEVIDASLDFFEAQRAGHINSKRVKWRGSACTYDQTSDGKDLTGGYFTAGQTTSITFPNAAALTVLAWGFLEFEDAYLDPPEFYDRTVEAIFWGADHLVKLHTEPDKLVVLLREETKPAGRFEDCNEPRTPYYITPENPGMEIAGEAAAALAASSMVADPGAKRDEYLSHARQLFTFAMNNPREANINAPNAGFLYNSFSKFDELAWAAVWLYWATMEIDYLNQAEQLYNTYNLGEDRKLYEFSWDQKSPGVNLLLYRFTKKQKYRESAKSFCEKVRNKDNQSKKGRYWKDWPNRALRYAVNAAFVCLSLGEIVALRNNDAIAMNPYMELAIQQVYYALGDTGRSFVVGLGVNPPLRADHVSACSRSGVCSTQPNEFKLRGAMVGGPNNKDDTFNDEREDHQNGVGVELNAGLQSAVAGLLSLHLRGLLPLRAYQKKV